jgi:hypothetical protein
MAYVYSNPEREQDTYALPDVEVFEMPADEVALLDEDSVHDYLKRFPLANWNSRERERMVEAMVEELGITGGWFYRFGFPGCMPDGGPIGPYTTSAEAVDAAREE